MKTFVCAGLFLCTSAVAEVHPITLRQALVFAEKQSPEVLLSRIEEQKAQQQVRVAQDPFFPKVFAGSGLAYTNGFPMSIEGSAPSVVQARAVASVYNLPQRYALARAREESRSASLSGQNRREKAYAETASLFLEAEQAARIADIARRQIESAIKMEEALRARVAEGRALPIEAKRAALELARARQRAAVLETDRDYAEESLAVVLGFSLGDRVRPAQEERPVPELPSSAEAAVEQALKDNREIRLLESSLLARSLEVKSYRAERWPKLDLVAQYGLFSRFNNYEDYFARFSRHNGQIGVSIQLPLVLGPAVSAQTQMADAEAARLRIEIGQTRGRIALETRRAFLQVERAESSRQVARLDLEVARDNLSILLERREEGRATLQEVEQARVVENEKWVNYFEAQYALERARFALLERTGNLMTSVRLP